MTGQANASSSTTVAVTVTGIGIQQNDIVLLVGMCGGSGTLTPNCTGFTSISGLSNVNINGGTFYALWKVAGASEPSSYTVTPGNTNQFTLQCRVYSGRNTSAPFSAKVSTGVQGPTLLPGTYAASAVTAVAGDDVIVFYAIEGPNSSDTFTFGTPTGFANPLTTSAGGTFTPPLFSADLVNASAGSTGTISSSVSDSDGKSLDWGAYTIALASGAATNTTITPPVGSDTITGNQPTVINGVNTVIQTFVARRESQLLMPDRRVQVPERKIFLPYRKAS